MNVCVYCASRENVAAVYVEAAQRLGRWIAENGHTLVFGGATGGLMDVVSQTVRDGGGYIVGVVPDAIVEMGRKSDLCDELLHVGSLSERKALMKEYADVCVALPGGIGTWDEVFDTVDESRLMGSKLVTVLVNVNGYYDGLVMQIDRMQQEGLGCVNRDYIRVCDSVESCIAELGKI